jgi:hypothetical protein
VPPVVARLDHLLVSPELEVSALSDLDPVGSDHRPFTARVQVGSSVGNGAPPVASAITEPEREAVG